MTDYTRLTIRGTANAADLVLPSDEPLAAMLPDVLSLLDEPAAGLDLSGRAALVRTLSDLAQDPYAPASVLVTHHVEEIPAGITHALLLKNGRLVAAGPVARIELPQRVPAGFHGNWISAR